MWTLERESPEAEIWRAYPYPDFEPVGDFGVDHLALWIDANVRRQLSDDQICILLHDVLLRWHDGVAMPTYFHDVAVDVRYGKDYGENRLIVFDYAPVRVGAVLPE